MAKYGSPSAWCLIDGYNPIPTKLKSMRHKIMARQEESTGLGDAWQEFTPTGVAGVEFEIAGGFFDTTATTGGHAMFSGSVPGSVQATQRIVTCGFAGQVLGRDFAGFQGTYSSAYEALGQVGALTKANAEHTISGQADNGKILQIHTALTANTTGTGVDGGASSANGGVGYLHVTAYSGFTSVAIKVQDSADDNTYADLVSFTNVTAVGAERVTVAGTVEQYLRSVVTVTGSGSITLFVGFARL